MGLGWVCFFVESQIVSYWLAWLCIGWLDCIGWIVLLDIAESGSYLLDWLDCIVWIGLDHNGWMRKHSFMHWLVNERMGRMDWMGR